MSHALKVSDEAGAPLFLSSGDFDPRNSVVLETAGLPRVGEGGGGSVAWKSRGTDRIELAVESKSDVIPAVSDADYPGWEADVDGKATPILLANLTFRAVAVPAGTHMVTIRFSPPSARYGMLLTGFSIAGILSFCRFRKQPFSSADGGILVA